MSIIEFSIFIENPAQISALYDRIQVWRSATEGGLYVDITSESGTPATLDGSLAAPWVLNTLSLNIALDLAAAQAVSFTAADPHQLSSVLSKINSSFPDLATEIPTDTDRVRLTSPTIGTQSAIQVSGTAAAVLGLSTTKVNGTSARPVISSNTETYLFRDYDGDDTFWYKTRFYSTETGAVSEYSAARQGGPGIGLPSSAIVTGKVAMADSTGSPIIGRRVIFVPVSSQVIDDGSGNNYAVLPSVERIVVITDSNGRATVKLVKGQRMKIFLEGTTFQREFVVPDNDFDVMTVASVQPDPLTIVQSPPMPIRS